MIFRDLRSLLVRGGCCIALVLVSAASLGLRESAAGSAYQASPNLLQNPSFEGDYSAWNWVNEAQVAPGWTPWWRDRTPDDPGAYYFKPEYKKADGYVYENRVHSGAAAQQWFTFYASHQAGMYQQVFGVTPGTRYRFTIWAQVWSSVKDNPTVSNDPADPRLQVGIDPRGFWNPWGDTVVWSGTYAFYDTWGQLTVEAVAQGDVLTVFMRSEPEWPVKHNDIYWDTAELVAVGQGDAPPPTSTAVPPTAVPPTATASETPPTAAPPTVTASETPPTAAPPTATQAGTTPPTVAPPTATCAPPPTDWVTYTVQPGDTLAQLATASETTVQALVSANCLRNVNIIEVGQALLLPASSSLPTPIGPTPTATAAASATPTRSIASPTAVLPTSIPSPVATATPWPTLTSTFTPTPIPTPALPPATAAAPTATYPASSLADVSGARWARFFILVTCMVLVLMLGFMLGKRSRS